MRKPSSIPIAIILAGLVLSPAAPTLAQTLILAGIEAPVPPAWLAVKPASAMRLAQFQVPGADRSQDAELVVFYFGPGQGGTPAANVARWQSQFKSPGGGSVEPRVRTFAVDSMAVTQAELRGDYARGVGSGPVGAAKPDQTLLAAIVEGPQGKLFVQLYGPTATVNAHRSVYNDFVSGMRRAAN